MALLPLTKGFFAIVDDADLPWLSQWSWQAARSGFRIVPRRGFRKDGRLTSMYLSRQIMNCPEDMEVDHVNGDCLDNQRSNLRVCLRFENAYNRAKKRGNSSGFKGVCLHKQNGRYQAKVCVGGKTKSAGCYKTPEEAARAYDRLAKEMFGEFARLNFPDDGGGHRA